MKVFNSRYKVIKVIGQGAYGEINLAEDIKYRRVTTSSNNQMQEESDKIKLELQKYVAIKKMQIHEMTGIDFTSIRELKILREVRHENVIGLRDVFAEDGSLFMALEYMVCDLGKLIDTSNISLNHQEISYIFYHIVKGMNHLHQNWILHRVSIHLK